MDASDGFLGQLTIHLVEGDQHDQAIHMFRHQKGIGQAQNRWSVVNHEIEKARLGDLLGQLMHAARTQQPGGIGGSTPRGNHRPARIVVDQLNGILPAAIWLCENIGEPLDIVHAQPVVELGFAQICVDEQDPFPHLREGFGQ